MTLSNMAVRQAKAIGKAYTLGDFDGLSLAVTDQGGRSWHFRYRWPKAINSKPDRKQRRRAISPADDHTFRAVFLQWVEHHRLELKEGRNSTLSQILRIFNRDV